MCPIVPTLQWGFERSNFSFAILYSLVALLPVACVGRRRSGSSPKTVSGVRDQRSVSPCHFRPHRLSSDLCSLISALLPLRPADDLIGDHAGRFFVARELHRVGGAALRGRANVVHIAEHFLERHDRLDDLRTGGVLHALDAPAARV